MKKTTKVTTRTVTTELATSPYGNVSPRIVLAFPREVSDRHRNADLYRLAADVELATPASEGWVVTIERTMVGGTITLELLHGTIEEGERGLAILERIAR